MLLLTSAKIGFGLVGRCQGVWVVGMWKSNGGVQSFTLCYVKKPDVPTNDSQRLFQLE